MNEVLQAATTFPTVILTVLLAVVILYWFSVILGALDVDLFGAEGAGDALEGAGEGLGEALEAGEAGDADGDGFLSNALSALGLHRVPVTISLSFIVLFAWFMSMTGTHLGPQLVGTSLSKWLIGPIVLIVALVIALIITSFVVRPLGPLFETKEAKRRTDYIGSMCTITTGRVDKEFGQATIEDGADVLVVDVRCDAADNKLARNQQAMIIDFDDERLAYVVETVEQ